MFIPDSRHTNSPTGRNKMKIVINVKLHFDLDIQDIPEVVDNVKAALTKAENEGALSGESDAEYLGYTLITEEI